MLCRSAFWRRKLERDIVPWTLHDISLGDEVLEIGPGPGLTTDLLRTRVAKLTTLEVDRSLARALSRRLTGTNVTVVHQDATEMRLRDACFTGVVCMTMLHHVPSIGLQDRVFAEVARVLRPGAVFVGCDRIFRSRFDVTHLFDTKVPILPESLLGRLRRAGFEKIEVVSRKHDFRFMAWKPGCADEPEVATR
jgi:ubiquinone/menaquinone biosynthesis C-methylase UbiE